VEKFLELIKEIFRLSTKIRLKRIGRRNRPFYRIVVIDSRKRRDGAAIEELGWYNPIDSKDSYKISEDRIYHWLGLGAQVSDTVHSILQKSGIAFKWHLKQQGLDEKAVEKELQKWQLKQAEKTKQEAAAKPKKVKKDEEKIVEEAAEEATIAVVAEPEVDTEETSEETSDDKVEASVEEPPIDDDQKTSAEKEDKEEKIAEVTEPVAETEKTSEKKPKDKAKASAEKSPADDDQNSSAEKAENEQQAGEGQSK